MNEREAAKNGRVFRETQSDVGEWLRRSIGDKARRGLGTVRDEAGAAGEKDDDDLDRSR